MAQKPLTDEQMQEALDLVQECGGFTAAASASKIPRTTLQSRCNSAIDNGMRAANDIPEGQQLRGTSTLIDGKGNIRLTWIKTKEDREKTTGLLKAMADEMAKALPKIKKRPRQKLFPQSELLNLINIGDAHVGSYIWEEECNNQSFDLAIAQRDLCTAMDYLIEESTPADTLIIAPVGDYLHADNVEGMTTKGTQMDLDTRMPKVIRTGVTILRYAIEKGLDYHNTVRMVITPGNHDEILSHCLSIMLDEVYRDEPRVIIHCEPTQRHYFVWGDVLLGWVHGHKIKDQSIPLVVATEQAVNWGKTKYRYIYRGHHHHKTSWGIQEFNGCIVEQIRPLVPSDAYATKLGLLAGNDCMSITMHKQRGEVKRITADLRWLRELQGT